MAITNAVNLYHAPAFAGQVADLQLSNIVSKLNKGKETIPAGVAVQADGADAVKALATGGTPIGIVVRELENVGPLGIAAGRTGSVLTMGVIWVKAGAAVTAGAAAYAGVGTDVAGTFTAAAGDSTSAAIAVPGAKFLGDAAKGELVRISITIGG